MTVLPSYPNLGLPASVNVGEMKRSFAQHGYAIARGVVSDAEVAEIRSTFDRIAANGAIPSHFKPLPAQAHENAPFASLPRVMHPHRFDPTSRKHLVHPGILTCLQHLMGDEMLAAQSMFCF